MRPFTRSLHPDDYAFLPHAEPLRAFEQAMSAAGVGHRAWCEHRLWEYASILQQLELLEVPKDAQILDVGSGGSFFPPYLATIGGYPHVSLTDSMAYGDIRPDIEDQREAYGVALPLYDVPAEDMALLPSDTWDVVLCISTIEHIAADRHDDALREICRLTKPDGLIFITSDYFRDNAHFAQSVSRHLQETPYQEGFVLDLPNKITADFVGDTDLAYRGDFVHNYSFCNIVLRKRAA